MSVVSSCLSGTVEEGTIRKFLNVSVESTARAFTLCHLPSLEMLYSMVLALRLNQPLKKCSKGIVRQRRSVYRLPELPRRESLTAHRLSRCPALYVLNLEIVFRKAQDQALDKACRGKITT